ncbi:ATP-binding protein [Frankia sp. CNm7]|uniref:ATP-binding protein n=1 Tax=Frankia nepalensis TaxID=1836974 RepID=A0A937R867_9ACTN|nr:ATP-binding protein [Frankia nepalensis]MBL7502441.1 ATP-binding protein [Frankia nepalensis]MBL7516306.1 ATP-binding protein [Frankia nepalensis]MBL7522065.1 ATP-binding protein [Frankia nepalensis]MBL7625670.1 ATP-binding protein [Frankia nepalensis]
MTDRNARVGDGAAATGVERPGGRVLVELRIDRSPESVPRARRAISSSLADAEASVRDLIGDVKLLAGELLTNAVLHGEPPVELRLVAHGDRLRVEVADTSRVTPLRAPSGADSMTGRGMALVAGLAARWGTEVRQSGKVVWAEFDLLPGAAAPNGAGSAAPNGAGSAAPDDGPAAAARSGSPATLTTLTTPTVPGPAAPVLAVPVSAVPDLATPDSANPAAPHPASPASWRETRHRIRLGDVSTDLLLAAKSHVDNLIREFTLAATGAASGESAAVPARLAELIAQVTTQFAEARYAMRRQALAAAAAGQARTQLELRLPASAADAAQDYLAALDEADEYARQAQLLTLESPPWHWAFRRWYISAIVEQLRAAARGQPVPEPLAFEDYVRAAGLPEPGPAAGADPR